MTIMKDRGARGQLENFGIRLGTDMSAYQRKVNQQRRAEGYGTNHDWQHFRGVQQHGQGQAEGQQRLSYPNSRNGPAHRLGAAQHEQGYNPWVGSVETYSQGWLPQDDGFRTRSGPDSLRQGPNFKTSGGHPSTKGSTGFNCFTAPPPLPSHKDNGLDRRFSAPPPPPRRSFSLTNVRHSLSMSDSAPFPPASPRPNTHSFVPTNHAPHDIVDYVPSHEHFPPLHVTDADPQGDMGDAFNGVPGHSSLHDMPPALALGMNDPTQRTVTTGASDPTQRTVTKGASDPTQQTITTGVSDPTQRLHSVTAGVSDPTQQTVTTGASDPTQRLQLVTTGASDPTRRSVTTGASDPTLRMVVSDAGGPSNSSVQNRLSLGGQAKKSAATGGRGRKSPQSRISPMATRTRTQATLNASWGRNTR
jgi:hypothetical protein